MDIEKFTHGGFKVIIHSDDDAESPREWCNLGTMVCFHRRYSLGDKHSLRSDQFGGWAEMRSYLEKEEGAVIVIPLFLLDHSGLAMRAGRDFSDCDPGGWDSGMVGFIYVGRARLLKEYGVTRLSKSILKKADETLRSEVETYDQFLRGEVYGYTVESADGSPEDSCWGFYGLENCKAEARRAADLLAAETEKCRRLTQC